MTLKEINKYEVLMACLDFFGKNTILVRCIQFGTDPDDVVDNLMEAGHPVVERVLSIRKIKDDKPERGPNQELSP